MTVLSLAIFLALFITLAALVWGVGLMAHGSSYKDENSEDIMLRGRLQIIAFTLLAIALVLFSSPG